MINPMRMAENINSLIQELKYQLLIVQMPANRFLSVEKTVSNHFSVPFYTSNDLHSKNKTKHLMKTQHDHLKLVVSTAKARNLSC